MNDRELRRRAEARLERPAGMPDRQDASANSPPQQKQPRLIALDPINEEIAVSEERMRQAINATDLAIWDYDLDSGRVHLSDSWSWLLGGPRTPTDTTIQQLTELVPEPDRGMVRDAILKAVKNPGFSEYRVTHRVMKPRGGFLWVQSEGKVMQRAPDGRALRMIGVNRDVTERKLLEDQLVMREARYRAVIDAAVDGFWMIDMEGRLLEVNDAYVRQSGYSREELLQMRVSDLEASERPAEVAAHQKKIKQTGHDRFESEHRRKDGSVWPVEIVVTYSPGLDLSFVFVVDATARKRAERQMAEQRQELEALQRSQIAAQTAAAFAHELNQPLGALASYTEAALMMLRAAPPDLDRLRDTIEKGRDQALRAGDSIRELLALLTTDLEAAEAIDLNREICDVLDLARTDAELSFRSELKMERGLPPVRANRMHLKKVVLNLLNNAVDAMREANVLKPSIVVTVRTRKDEGLAQVTVQDNGPGITGEDLTRLFEPFFTTKKKGIGMGLAISRSLIEANGGQLWCDPSEGPGAVFHLTLPFAE
jgi:two-component system sensor kinase FixL